MDSSTYGVPVNSPNGYAPSRLGNADQYSGIFVHSAPWSVGSQGYTQHQPRMPQRQPAQRQLVLRQHQRGDIVEIVNTVGDPARHRWTGGLEHPVGAMGAGNADIYVARPWWLTGLEPATARITTCLK